MAIEIKEYVGAGNIKSINEEIKKNVASSDKKKKRSKATKKGVQDKK